jgi:hypothetical protein
VATIDFLPPSNNTSVQDNESADTISWNNGFVKHSLTYLLDQREDCGTETDENENGGCVPLRSPGYKYKPG